MKIDKFKPIIIYEILSIAALTTAVLFCVRDLLVWEVNEWLLLIFCLLSTAFVCCCRIYYKNKYLYLCIGTVLVFFALLILVFRPKLTDILESVTFLVLCVSLATGIGSYLIFQYRVVRTILIALGFLLLVILPFLGIDLSMPAVAAILYLCVFTSVDIYMDFYHKRKKEAKDYRSSASFFPFYILPLIVVILIPKTQEPIQWNFVKDCYKGIVKIYENASDYVENVFTEMQFAMDIYPEEYRMSIIGYSGQGLLGGKISDNQSKVLQISGKKPAGNTYFTGAISDTYTGSSWEKNVDWSDYEEEYYLDYAEMLRAMTISGIDAEVAQDNIDVSTLTISHLNLRTKTLFYPLKVTNVVNYGKSDYTSSGPNIVYEKAVKTKTSGYRVTFMDIDYQSEWMTTMLSDSSPYAYDNHAAVSVEEMEDTQKTLLNVRSNGNIAADAPELLEERASYIQEEYLQLPDTLPKRVRDLAEEVTVGCESDYEKMNAIQVYLAGFTYTKSPQEITSGDFVDEFLFNIKEGYCSYFASVMSVMGRCVGVPTRYVEGFFCDYTTMSSPDQYIISSNKGHAWCEYYVEGIGWIPIEATKGCGYTRNYFHGSGAVSGDGTVMEQTSSSKDIKEIYDEITKEQEEVEEKQVEWDKLFSVVFIAVGLVSCVLVGCYIWIRLSKKLKYKKATPREKILYKAAEIYRLLDDLESGTKEAKTVELYMEQIDKYLEGESRKLKKPYLSARYSEHEVDEKTIQIFESAEQRLRAKAMDESHGFRKIRLWI